MLFHFKSPFQSIGALQAKAFFASLPYNTEKKEKGCKKRKFFKKALVPEHKRFLLCIFPYSALLLDARKYLIPISVPTVSRIPRGKQIQIVFTKPATTNITKEITATVMA